MEISRLSDLKPRTVWEITDDAFDMYRERFASLASISAVVFVPIGILFVTVGVAAWKDLIQLGEGPDHVRGLINLAWLLPLLFIGYMLHYGATAVAVRDVLQGENASLASVYKQTFKRLVPLFLTSLYLGIFGFLSLCITIGPALIAGFYCFTPHGVVLEERKTMDALKRSRDMAQAYFGKTLGLILLMSVVGTLLVYGLQSVLSIVLLLFPQPQGSAAAFEMEQARELFGAVSSAVIIMLLAPLPAIATTLLYYDLRVRREGLDLEFEAEQWGVPLAPDPFGGVLNPKVPKVPKIKVGRR